MFCIRQSQIMVIDVYRFRYIMLIDIHDIHEFVLKIMYCCQKSIEQYYKDRFLNS